MSPLAKAGFPTAINTKATNQPTINLPYFIGPSGAHLDCREIYFTRPFGWFLFYSSVHKAAHRAHLQLVTLENGFEARASRSDLHPVLANANNVASVYPYASV